MSFTDYLVILFKDTLALTPGFIAEWMHWSNQTTEQSLREIFWLITILLAIIRTVQALKNKHPKK